MLFGVCPSCRHLSYLGQYGHQFVNNQGLLHESIRAILHALLSVFLGPVGGQNDNGRLGPDLFDPGQNFAAVKVGQVKVQYNQREIFPLQGIERLLPVVANFATAASEIQPFSQHICKPALIIND
jgi:hypothetical protein